MRPVWGLLLTNILLGCLTTGCRDNPFVAPNGSLQVPTPNQVGAATNPATNPAANPFAQANQTLSAQLKDLNTRIAQLDANNQDLTKQLAQTDQGRQQMQSQLALLQKQLGETGARLKEAQNLKLEAEKRAEAILASAKQRGGAILSANSSVQNSLQAIQLPGLEVRQEAEVVRIELPADRLFTPGGYQLNGDGTKLVDDVAAAILQAYPRQRIIVEGHTDDSLTANPTAAHGLSGAQAQAVFQQLVARNRFPANQLSIVAMGANHPRVSNATPTGKAKNRRVEIAIYPDPFAG